MNMYSKNSVTCTVLHNCTIRSSSQRCGFCYYNIFLIINTKQKYLGFLGRFSDNVL